MGQFIETAIDALSRRILADAERRTDFLKGLAFHEVQDHRLPVRFAQFQERLVEQRHERRPHGITFRPGRAQIDCDLFPPPPAQFAAQPFAGFIQGRLVQPAGDGRVRPQFTCGLRQRHEDVLGDFLSGAGIANLPADCANAAKTFCVISSAAPASPTCRTAME